MGKSLLFLAIFPVPSIIKKLSNWSCHLNNSLKSFNSYTNIESLHTLKKMYEVTKFYLNFCSCFFLTSILSITFFFFVFSLMENVFPTIYSFLNFFLLSYIASRLWFPLPPPPNNLTSSISYPLLILFFQKKAVFLGVTTKMICHNIIKLCTSPILSLEEVTQ